MNVQRGEAFRRIGVVVAGTALVTIGLVFTAGQIPLRRAVVPLSTPIQVEVGLVEIEPPALPKVEEQPRSEPAPRPKIDEPQPQPRPEPLQPSAELPPPEPEPPPPKIEEPTPETSTPPPKPVVKPRPAPKPKPLLVEPRPETPPVTQSAPVAEPAPSLPMVQPPATHPVEEPGGGTSAARAIDQPMPEIPPELRRQALHLVAVVKFTIRADGSATAELEQPTPDPRLNRVLLDTFKRWRFFPAMNEGKPVPSTLTLRVPVTVE